MRSYLPAAVPERQRQYIMPQKENTQWFGRGGLKSKGLLQTVKQLLLQGHCDHMFADSTGNISNSNLPNWLRDLNIHIEKTDIKVLLMET